MLISARLVKPRKIRRCEMCDRLIVDRALRLYGSPEHDRPFVIWCHPDCVGDSNRKIAKAKGLEVVR